MGLAGAGDLILTCTGELSRNRRVGLLLAKGEPLDAVLRRLGHVAEGVFSARAVESLAAEKSVDMPITRAVCAVSFPRRFAPQMPPGTCSRAIRGKRAERVVSAAPSGRSPGCRTLGRARGASRALRSSFSVAPVVITSSTTATALPEKSRSTGERPADVSRPLVVGQLGLRDRIAGCAALRVARSVSRLRSASCARDLDAPG